MRKLIFILTAGVIVLLIIVAFFFIQSQKTITPPLTPPQPTPFQLSNPSPSITTQTNPLEAYELLKQVPYSSTGFNIEYLTVSEVLMITIKESPVEAQKQAALSWIQDQGFDPQDFNIQYNIYPYLQ